MSSIPMIAKIQFVLIIWFLKYFYKAFHNALICNTSGRRSTPWKRLFAQNVQNGCWILSCFVFTSQLQQSRAMYLPSFGFLGPTSRGPTSHGPTSLNAVMGDLFGGAPSLDINEPDSGSDFAAGKESLQDMEEGLADDDHGSQASRDGNCHDTLGPWCLQPTLAKHRESMLTRIDL